jgi:hypothetical protein
MIVSLPRIEFTARCSSGVAVSVCLTALLVGCGQREEIRRYKVPRVAESPRPVKPSARPIRMLAAIVPHKDQAWFFKLTGAPDAAAAKFDEFEAFLKSITFSDAKDAKPTWQLPAGWRQEGASGMRLATIRIGSGDDALELSVIPLPRTSRDFDADCLDNINRWRGQIDLPPIDRDRLADETTELDLPDGHKAVVVNMVGGSIAPLNPAAAPPADAGESSLKYDVPEGWMPGKLVPFSEATFEVQADGQRVVITVSPFAGPAGEVLRNVNRWRGQVKLDETTDDELKQEAKKIEVGGVEGTYVELIGPESASPRQTILGVIAFHGGKSWFLKLQGDSELAAREKSHFDEFVKSVRF